MAVSSGYQKLASFMVQEKYSFYRQFQELACEDLLYRQSELVHLQRDIQLMVQHDQVLGRAKEEKVYSFDWRKLSTSAQRGSPSKQWEKRLEIRSKIREYYETLLLYKRVFSEPQPKNKDVDALREWIERPDLGGGCGFIGRDLGPLQSAVYDNEYRGDLMAVVDRGGQDDPFTAFLTGPVFYTFDVLMRRLKACGRRDLEKQTTLPTTTNMIRYSDSHITWVVEFLGTILASAAPMTSIIALYFVQNMSVRLGIVCAFTVAFAAILKLATRARRVEVFAITAAFCSVQVVFLGTTTSK